MLCITVQITDHVRIAHSPSPAGSSWSGWKCDDRPRTWDNTDYTRTPGDTVPKPAKTGKCEYREWGQCECDDWTTSVVSWPGVSPLQKWYTRNRKEDVLSVWGQRLTISSTADTIQAGAAAQQLYCSVSDGQWHGITEYPRPPGSLGKNNSCLGDDALLFSAFVRIYPPPTPDPVNSPPKPSIHARLSLLPSLQFQTTNAKTMCWCKCMGVGLQDPWETPLKSITSSKVSISEWTKFSGLQLEEPPSPPPKRVSIHKAAIFHTLL